MRKQVYTLVLNVPASAATTDERYEFEPFSRWFEQEDGSFNVEQRVYLDGGRVFGVTDTFQEQLSDIVREVPRFVSLKPTT
jgi:hypothetical protein